LNQKKPAELFYDNLMMGTQLIHAAYQAGVENLFVLAPSAPIPPRYHLKRMICGTAIRRKPMLPTELPKALLVQLQAYRQQYGFDGIYLLPVNLYGPEDNFDPSSSHVIPALIRKVHDAQLKGERSGFGAMALHP
jgi:GDP-L-fucose synthase